MRNLRQCFANASASDDDGVIGYHAAPSRRHRRAQRGRAVAVDEDAVADACRAARPEPERRAKFAQRSRAPGASALQVGLEQRFLALVLLGDELSTTSGVDVEQRGQRAEVDDVLEELALPRVAVRRVADRGERHADRRHVLAKLRRRQRPVES